MIIYDYFRSSASFRVRIALNLKDLQPELRSVHLAKGEQRQDAYKAINPQGFVPFLIEDDDEGDRFTLSQSMAIIEYLDEIYPNPPLMPTTARERAFVRQIAQIVACDIHPLNNTRILETLTNKFLVTEEAKVNWYCGWIRDGFAAIEALLAARKNKATFCLGNTPTLADICLIPQVVNAHRFACALEKFPLITNIYQQAMKLPAFELAHPLNQVAA